MIARQGCCWLWVSPTQKALVNLKQTNKKPHMRVVIDFRTVTAAYLQRTARSSNLNSTVNIMPVYSYNLKMKNEKLIIHSTYLHIISRVIEVQCAVPQYSFKCFPGCKVVQLLATWRAGRSQNNNLCLQPTDGRTEECRRRDCSPAAVHCVQVQRSVDRWAPLNNSQAKAWPQLSAQRTAKTGPTQQLQPAPPVSSI